MEKSACNRDNLQMGDCNKSRSDKEVLDLAGNAVESDAGVITVDDKGKEGVHGKKSGDNSSDTADCVVSRDDKKKSAPEADLKKKSDDVVSKDDKKRHVPEANLSGDLKKKSDDVVSKDDKKEHVPKGVVPAELKEKSDSEQFVKERTCEKNVCKDKVSEIKERKKGAVEFLVSIK